MQVSFELRISSDKKGTKLKNEKVWELQNEKTFENWGPIKYCENWEKYDNMRTKKYENYRMRKLLNPPPKLVYL